MGVSVRETPSSPRGQTDACENITLPKTSFAGGNYYLYSKRIIYPSPLLTRTSGKITAVSNGMVTESSSTA